ncbi:MAG: MgtC/SapB family protein [Acidobacteria bacterium]|nr:MgtC/SapB family protein [Acidobacteriota bacterium]
MDWREQLQIRGEVALAMGLSAVIGADSRGSPPACARTCWCPAPRPCSSASASRSCGASAGPRRIRSFGWTAVVIRAVVTAVGFLGAGTILHRSTSAPASPGEHVEGLKTAASLLFVAALGTCVAVRQILVAVGITALGWLTLRVVGRLEERLRRRTAARPAPR